MAEPRIYVTDHVMNVIAPSLAEDVIGCVEEWRYYLAHKREYTGEERAGFESRIACEIPKLRPTGVEVPLFEFHGYAVSICGFPYSGEPFAFLRGWGERIEICLEDLAEGEYLDKFEKELDALLDDAIFRTEMFWFSLGFEVPDLEAPETMLSGAVRSFRECAAEGDGDFGDMLDEADRDAHNNPGKIVHHIGDCLAYLGYLCIGTGFGDGNVMAFLQSPADSDLLEFFHYDPKRGFKMAAVYRGILPVPERLATGSATVFFDTGNYTVSNEGKLFALKTWGLAGGNTPVTYGVAEFCLFDKMVCDASYGIENVPRWRAKKSPLPDFEQEHEGAYDRVKKRWDSLSEENYLFAMSQPERLRKGDGIPEWKLRRYRGEL